MVYNCLDSQQNQQIVDNKSMHNLNISLQQQFFTPPNQQQLNQQTPANALTRSNTKILQTAIPSISQNNSNVQREVNGNQAKFFQQYKRIYNISYSLFEQKKRMKDQIKEALLRLQSMENRLNNLDNKSKQIKTLQSNKKYQQSSDDNKNKRSRRTAEQIEKKYQCHAHQCQRYYGSQGSLQQHIKLKHPQLLKKEQDDQDDPYEKSGEQYVDNSMPV